MSKFDNIVRIEGKRVNLCALRTDEDAIKKYTQWMNDSDIAKYLGRSNRIATLTDETEWAKHERPNSVAFNIVDKSADTLIGNCEITIYNRSITGNIGIAIGERDKWGTGLGTEVLQLLVKYAFEELRLHRLQLSVDESNKRAIHCYEKVGFHLCGTFHEAMFHDGYYYDKYLMEYLESEYSFESVE